MPKGSRQAPCDCWMAERKSPAVSSSQWVESLACDQPDKVQKNSSPNAIIALRMTFPPKVRILALPRSSPRFGGSQGMNDRAKSFAEHWRRGDLNAVPQSLLPLT